MNIFKFILWSMLILFIFVMVDLTLIAIRGEDSSLTFSLGAWAGCIIHMIGCEFDVFGDKVNDK